MIHVVILHVLVHLSIHITPFIFILHVLLHLRIHITPFTLVLHISSHFSIHITPLTVVIHMFLNFFAKITPFIIVPPIIFPVIILFIIDLNPILRSLNPFPTLWILHFFLSKVLVVSIVFTVASLILSQHGSYLFVRDYLFLINS